MKLLDGVITAIKSFLGKKEVKILLKKNLLMLITGVAKIVLEEKK